MAQIIKTNGQILEVQPQNGTDFQLEEMQAIVNGYIEMVPLHNGEIMIVNEEGKFTCSENYTATFVAKHYNVITNDDYIFGDVLICKDEEIR